VLSIAVDPNLLRRMSPEVALPCRSCVAPDSSALGGISAVLSEPSHR
jgi:hypothetical protein